MKAQIAAKYIQFLSNKKANKNSGFTLIELLVVIIIIGILSAIALPSFLNQAAKARASEARTNVGAMNRAQQAFYLENQRFAVDTAAVVANSGASPPVAAVAGGTASQLLGIGVKDTANYLYTSASTTPTTSVINKGSARNKDLKGHVGASFSTGGQTPTILCEATAAGVSDATNLPDPTLTGDAPGCANGTVKVGG